MSNDTAPLEAGTVKEEREPPGLTTARPTDVSGVDVDACVDTTPLLMAAVASGAKKPFG